MGFVVTEEMTAELFQHPGRIIYGDKKARLELLQGFIDRHNLAPASAVEEVELTDRQVYELFFALKYPSGGSNSETIRMWQAENGLRIVRDAKPVPKLARPLPGFNADGKLVRAIRCSGCGEMLTGLADTRWRIAGDHWEHKCGDAQAGHFEARDFGELVDDAKPVPADDAAKRDAKDATIAELMKRIGDLEIGYRDAKATNMEIMDLKQRLDSLERVARAEILGLGKRLAYFEHFSGISLSSANAKETAK